MSLKIMNYNADSSFENSMTLFRYLLSEKHPVKQMPPPDAENTDFGSDFSGNLIKQPHYTDCRFIKSVFHGASGDYSQWARCSLVECDFNSSNFEYSMWDKCLLNQCKVESSSFKYSNFEQSEIISTRCKNASFNYSSFQFAQLQDVELNHCSFEGVDFRNTKLINTDFSKCSLRYSKFLEAKMDRVVCHVLDIANNFGLLQALNQPDNKIIIIGGQDREVINLEIIPYILNGLLPYYLEIHQFFPAINIFLYQNELDNAWYTIKKAFQFSIQNDDFVLLKNICMQIVDFNVFSRDMLKELYQLIKLEFSQHSMPTNILNSYLTYIEQIRIILLDENIDKYQAHLFFETSIAPLQTEELACLISSIETNLQQLLPGSAPKFELTHHSPYEIMVSCMGVLPELLQACQVFYYTLGGIKTLSELSQHEHTINNQIATKKRARPSKSSNRSLTILLGRDGFKFEFKSQKEFLSNVNSMEYTITKQESA